MPLFDVKYSEVQTRVWFISIEAETAEETRKILHLRNDDIWEAVKDGRAEWSSASGADGEAIDTLESEIEVDDTPIPPSIISDLARLSLGYHHHSQSKRR